MRTRITLLIFLLCCLFSGRALAETTNVSREDAFSIARNQFVGRDVDYYILQDNNERTWTIYVDAEPMKGWPHEAYLLGIPKTIETSVENAGPRTKIKISFPSTGKFVPLAVKNRYGNNANSKPAVKKITQSNSSQEAAERTYAIILSGGNNKLSNYERYWNDCSFIYQTLVNSYGVPKENIFPIMSDGDNPAEDMISTSGVSQSQPLDLDFDGVDDIELSATKENIQSALDMINNRIQENDHLFFYVIDHGGTDDYENSSYICLWNRKTLKDTELAEMLEPFTDKLVNVNVLLGQCYSGGFIEELTKIGCVTAVASSGSEPSWSCMDIPYDEFVYQWTCAVNGATHRNFKVYADTDKNGYVSMQEAFEYAKNHDRIAAEHPQYHSTPISIGEDLAFNHLPSAIDLYIKDNPEDTGKEPNITTNEFWKSPSIWVRNKDDGIYKHENPYYDINHVAVTVYVRVYNRGKKDYNGEGKYMHVYWAKASTGFRPQTWIGYETDVNGEITGGPMTPSKIPAIPAGEYRDVKITWALPTDYLGTTADNGTDKHHFCLLAKIMDTHIEPWHSGSFSYNCKASNKDAQKNVSIISKIDITNGTNVFIRNIKDTESKYSLSIVPHAVHDEAIYSRAIIEMELSQPVYTAWERGGLKSNNIRRNTTLTPSKVQFLSKESKLEAISLAGQEFDIVRLKFLFKTPSPYSETYTLDLIQRDEDDNIIGGETFIVESPTIKLPTLNINATPLSDNQYKLITDADSNEHIRWENNSGDVICENNSVTVTPYCQNDNTYYAYAFDTNGDMSTAQISLVNLSGIDKVCRDSSNKHLLINLRGAVPYGACITLSSISSGKNLITIGLDKNESNLSIDISELTSGLYTISYSINDIIVDTAKFAVQ